MKNRSILFASLLILIGLFYAFVYESKPVKTLYISAQFKTLQEIRKTFIQKKPVILWDLHGVLFTKNTTNYFTQGFWKIQNKLRFVFEFFKALLNSTVRKQLLYCAQQNISISQAYFESVHGYPHLYKELIVFVNNIYKPNTKTAAIVKKLSESGYRQYLFSNIGPVVLADLQRTYPYYFEAVNKAPAGTHPPQPGRTARRKTP